MEPVVSLATKLTDAVRNITAVSAICLKLSTAIFIPIAIWLHGTNPSDQINRLDLHVNQTIASVGLIAQNVKLILENQEKQGKAIQQLVEAFHLKTLEPDATLKHLENATLIIDNQAKTVGDKFAQFELSMISKISLGVLEYQKDMTKEIQSNLRVLEGLVDTRLKIMEKAQETHVELFREMTKENMKMVVAFLVAALLSLYLCMQFVSYMLKR